MTMLFTDLQQLEPLTRTEIENLEMAVAFIEGDGLRDLIMRAIADWHRGKILQDEAKETLKMARIYHGSEAARAAKRLLGPVMKLFNTRAKEVI